ncbi:hypothetical protein IKG64_01390 [Candidatus Saccharibacteria bacterium]|nr:hypothetical protein [Candidatus Saccharibacteria bacterium]
MTKNNEYVGVDEKYRPKEAKEQTHVSEPIIGSENSAKIRNGIKNGADYLASEKGQEKVKKNLKTAKRLGTFYIIAVAFVFIVVAIVLAVIIAKFISMSNK